MPQTLAMICGSALRFAAKMYEIGQGRTLLASACPPRQQAKSDRGATRSPSRRWPRSLGLLGLLVAAGEDPMNVAHRVSAEAPIEAGGRLSSMPLRILRDALLPVSLVLWAIGVSKTNVADEGLYGLPAILPFIFYAGIGLLLVSVGIQLARPKLSEARLGAHAVSLVVILYGTGALVYKDGRYSWLYKSVGVIQYVDAHGSLNRTIDIFQEWPGFFALAAWFERVAGTATALDFAKWSQVVFELAVIPLLYSIYQSLSLPVWHRWVGILLYSGSNWIAQDYLSPQGMSTLLDLGIMAIVARWILVVIPQASTRSGDMSPEDGQVAITRGNPAVSSLRSSAPIMAVLALLFFVLTASHELSPYVVVVQLACLAVAGLARPRWIPLLAAAIAIAYLLPNFSFVNSHYGLTSSIGNFFGNVQTSGVASGTPPPESHKIIADCTLLLSAGIWVLALVGAWLRRKARRIVLALLLLTYSPILVLLGGAYGNEGILRVYLFSLPWAAALAACALAPVRSAPARQFEGSASASADSEMPAALVRKPSQDAGRGGLRAVVPIALAIALFFPSFYGDDSSNEMPQDQVNTLLAFQEHAVPGPVLCPIVNLPFSDTAKYNLFPIGAIFGSGGVMGNDPVTPAVDAFLARTLENYTAGKQPGYIVITPSMEAWNQAYAVTSPESYTTLVASMAKSPYWTRVVDQGGTIIYKLSTAARTIKPGPSAQNPEIAVPLACGGGESRLQDPSSSGQPRA